MGLAYNSDTLHVQPLIYFSLASVAGDPVPTTLQAQLTWNNGSAQPWVTISTTGLSGGGTYWFALQVSSQVSSTGVYPRKVEVQATLPNGGGTIDRTVTGIASVVATDNTGTVDPYGPGWSVAGLDSLVPVSASTGVPAGVLFVYGTGGYGFFQSLGGGAYLSPVNDFGTLTSVGTNPVTYTYVSKDDVTYTFNGSGQLLTITDPHNLTVTFAYSGSLLSTVAEPDGGVGTFHYTNSRLTSIDEPGGRTVTIRRTTAGDGLSDMTGLTMPDGGLRTFGYDTAHRLLTDDYSPRLATYAFDAGTGALNTITLAGGETGTVKPAAVQEVDSSAAQASQPDLVTDALNHTTTFVFSGVGWLLSETAADGGVRQWTRDQAGHPTTATDPDGNVTTYSYLYGPYQSGPGGGAGDLMKVSFADGSTNQFQYEGTFHHMTLFVDGNGNRTTMTYDATTGDLLTVKDALGNVTSYVCYQSGGRSNGLVQSITDPNGNVTSFQYDSNRRLTQ
jgi:YD repeat-containing protein